MSPLGRQYLVEYSGCDPEILSDPGRITEAMLQAARLSGATIVTHSFHHFAPLGVSGVVIISESHLAIHTWPEHGFAAVDYFTCGNQIDMPCGLDHLRMALGAGNMTSICLERGLIPSEAPLRG